MEASTSSSYPMFSTGKYIKEGDIVIMQLSRESLSPITITAGENTQNRYGHYLHDQMIGVPFGSRIPSSNQKGFVHLLRPTPELWTLALPHRTQILYVADIAYILSELSIRPGSVVVEAGTGSGSFSHSVGRAILPNGMLHSFEFHETRAEKARIEFIEHGMCDIVTLRHRNVCKDGFELEGVADAVFLDLPAPWDAVASAKAAMRTDVVTRICCFSPCIEQVLRTVTALSNEGFSDISMSETLLRQHEILLNVPLPPIGSAIDKLKDQAIRKESRRLAQIASSKAHFGASSTSTASSSTNPPLDPSLVDDSLLTSTTSAKRKEPPSPPASGTSTPTTGNGNGEERTSKQQQQRRKGDPVPFGTVQGKPIEAARGHTSYLTFATLLPVGLRGGKEGVVEEDGEEEEMEGEEDGELDAAIAKLTEEEMQTMLGGGASVVKP